MPVRLRALTTRDDVATSVDLTAAKARANHTGTQVAATISDFDSSVAVNSAVAANTAKVTNQTHIGEVTGSVGLVVDKTAITGKTVVTAVGTDYILISDTSDSGNLKKALASDVVDGATMYIGTTAHALNRASAAEGLAGITGLTPGANFVLTQNSVAALTSVESGAVVNTLYLSAGNVGIGTNSPLARSHIFKENVTSRTAPQDLLYLGTDHASVGYDGFGTAIVDFRRTYQNATPHAVNRITFIERGDSINDFGGAICFETKALNSGSAAPVERMRIDYTGNVFIGGFAARATTEGTNRLDIYDGTAPVGTLTNGISLYSTSGELRVMDAAGNATLLSPHDKKDNAWVFDSVDVNGKRLKIDVEKLLKKINDKFGWDFIHDGN